MNETASGDLAARVALVTGAASGMGRTHALALAARGAKLVLGDTNGEGLEQTAAMLDAGHVVHGLLDVTDAAAVEALVARGRERFGYVDVVVNNAGYGQKGSIEDIVPDELARMLSVHVGGAFNCTRAALADMKARRYGKIVNISSMWGMTGWHTAGAHL